MNEIVIGFLGCGNVGGGVWKLLENFAGEIAHRDHVKIRVKKVLVRDVNKARSCAVPAELLTTAVEAVTKKKIDPKYEGYLHAAGMILLMGLMAIIMFKDIFVLFKG